MQTRLLIASAALTAVVGLSASVAVSMAGTNHDAAKAATTSSAETNGHPVASAGSAGLHARPGMPAAAEAASSTVNHGTPISAGAAASSSTPTLATVQGGAHMLARGAQKAVPVAVSEDQAMQAIFKGGMWLPNASGGREYAKYDHHLIHDNGDWTWVGKVQTTHGLESAVITFGKDAVFGRIPQASGHALRLVTAGGQKLLVQTDGAKMAASAENVQLHARQDFKIPQHTRAGAPARTTAQAQTSTTAQSQTLASSATTSGGPTIDVMVAYTSGVVSAYGSASAALTRINNLVDITNQAYADSGVSQRIRLVHTMQVSYTDTNDNTKALDDVTGDDGKGNSLPIPSSLQGVASARTQYGADLVVLLRHFNNAGNNGCGVAWLIGGNQTQIDPTQDNAFGYSVVQDGSDGGYFCLDTSFAHELGHNMGSAHDRAHADKNSSGNPIPGAYAYSFGYLGNGAAGFSTIMAYGSDTQTPVNYFSNPGISKCQNSPCGVADSSTSSADNAHSLNNTASLIAQFEGTKVAATGGKARNDIDGDGRSDLLFQNPTTRDFGWWLMNGTTTLSMHDQAVTASGYTVVATGDFNGDGKVDIVWTNSAHAIYIWFDNGNGGFTSPYVGNYPSDWQIVGAGDVDGDGKADLLFNNPSRHLFGYWLMDGTKILKMQNIGPVGAGYRVTVVGDFNGDGKIDLVWTSSRHDLYMWTGNGVGFSSRLFGSYPASWTVVGAGDIDGDGKDDLQFSNSTQHLFGYWLMSGLRILKMQNIGPVGAGYRVATAGDYNGDGKADIVWTSNANDLYMWTGDGRGFHSQQFGSYPVGSQVIR